MKVSDLVDHFKKVGHWVNWQTTCDRVLHGSADAEVRGIATTWIPTNKVIAEAASRDLNLIVSHEPLFYDRKPPYGLMGTDAGEAVMARKRRLLNEASITVIRCHDVWDRMPTIGIPDSWAAWLGFETEPRPVESYHKVCLTGARPLASVAAQIREKVARLGQDWLLVFGDGDKQVNRLAIGTGAITRLSEMHALGVDAALLTDDGMTTWEAGYFSADTGFPIVIVNHATAEKPGMMAMRRYLADLHPAIRVEYLDVELPWRLG
jgi:putative NIF3 family GTP cyclohydrolase 1 type 2